MHSTRKTLLALSLAAAAAPALSAPTDAEVGALRERLQELEKRMEATGAQVDRVSREQGGGSGATTIGGYGELHYNSLDNQMSGGEDKDALDFHRFVLFLGHEFSDDIRLFSELEVEHSLAGDGAPGEVELEQAYVEFDLNDTTRTKGGMFLVPVGILNETHEPPTFYGTERNPVEKNIIPSTWWEGGAALGGELTPGLNYDLAVHSGLFASDYDIRGGRQKVAKAKADALAYTGRLKWTGVAGLELAATVNHQTDITQDEGSERISGNLLETHAVYQSGPFGLRALYATWDLDDDGTANGRDEQEGWYIEPSFRLTPKIGMFARYNVWDRQAGDSDDSEYRQTDVGVNYWPHEDVVLKLDYQDQDAPEGQNEYDGINVGIGFQF